MASRGENRLVVEVDLPDHPTAEITAAFDRLSLSVSFVSKPAATASPDAGDYSGARTAPVPTCGYTKPLPPHQASTAVPGFSMRVPYCRHEAVLNCLNDAIKEMNQVAMNLKTLATVYIVDDPSSGKEILVNQLMYRVRELAQSLDQASGRYQLVHDDSEPPLPEYFHDSSDSDHDDDCSGVHWSLEQVNWEEILDRQMK